MIKNKYQRLNKEERKNARNRFYKTEFGRIQKPRFDRILIVGILLSLFSLYLLIDAIIKHNSIWGYVSAIIIFVFALVFLVGRHKIIVRDVNNYLIKKK